jgi:hypothetical protein
MIKVAVKRQWLTEAQCRTAAQLPWYREWLVAQGWQEDKDGWWRVVA